MGMFDYVKIQYKLPWPEVQDALWQSKDTPDQCLTNYEIRDDGTLWQRRLPSQMVDESDIQKWKSGQYEDCQWLQVDFSGAFECHVSLEHDGEPGYTRYSIQFWFRDGVVKDAIYTKTEH